MNQDPGFAGLMDRLRHGEEDAAADIYRAYVRRLVALAARQLGATLRGKADPESAVQSAFGSFFRCYRAGQFDLGDWADLWGLLALITARKCGRRRAYWLAGRRDVRREGGGSVAAGTPIAADREPTPEEAAELAETVAEWLAGIAELDRRVLELGLAGLADDAIAVRLARSERTVQRVRLRAERQLRARLATSGDRP